MIADNQGFQAREYETWDSSSGDEQAVGIFNFRKRQNIPTVGKA